MASAELTEQATQLMAALNRTATQVMAFHDVHACTDITGFGLIGHLAEMVNCSNIGVAVDTRSLPILPEALDFAAMGLIPTGAYKNREFRAGMVRTAATVERAVEDLLYDLQTLGGLLIAVDEREAELLMTDLFGNGGRIVSNLDGLLPKSRFKKSYF